MATISIATGVASGVQPRGTETGINAKHSVVTQTDSISVSDVFQMVKIGTGQTVVGGFITGNAVGGTATVKIGDGGSEGRYLAAITLSTANQLVQFNAGLPYTYSISDDATVRFDTIDVVISAMSASPSASFAVVVQYGRDVL